MTGPISKVLNEDSERIPSAKIYKPAMEAMAKLCKQRHAGIQTAGQASKIKKVLNHRRDGERLSRANSIRKSPDRRPLLDEPASAAGHARVLLAFRLVFSYLRVA